MAFGTIIGIIVLVILIGVFSGAWLFAATAGSGLFILQFLAGGKVGLTGIAQFNMLNSFTWVAIPLFVFMGNILTRSRLAERLYSSLSALVCRLPGGLLQTNVVACAIFGACSGSSLAGAATMGTLVIPQLRERGYPPQITYGSIAAGGTLCSMIPPSIAFIVYGGLTNVSIGQLFLAGIIPGIVLALLFMSYIAITAMLHPGAIPQARRYSWKQILMSLQGLTPTLLIIIAVLGSIYLGYATPTEAGAIGVVIVIVLTLIYRDFSWRMMIDAARATVITTSMLLMIVVGGELVSMGLSQTGAVTSLIDWVVAFNPPRMVVWAAVASILVAGGCIIDGTCLMVLTVPIYFPLMMAFHFDPIWLGVMAALFIEVGLVTPPVGLNLFVVYGISGEKSLAPVARGSAPFFVAMIVFLIIATVFPGMSTWLPSLMFNPWG
jgi:C4-dicarboxylate transporter DctM subunit